MRLILGRWLKEDASPTDAALTSRLKQEYGVAVSRRTVNAVRHELATQGQGARKNQAAA